MRRFVSGWYFKTVCPFCGRRATTDEHVLPDWLKEHWKSMGEGRARYVQASYYPDGTSDHAEWDQVPATQEVKMCQSCNTVLWSNLESRAKNPLIPLIDGTAEQIRGSDVRTIAAWLTKTAFVWQLTHPRMMSVPRAHYVQLRETELPPKNLVIWIGRYSGTTSLARYFHRPLPLRVLPEEVQPMFQGYAEWVAYSITGFVGELAFSVFGERVSLPQRARPGPAFRGVLRPLWPSDGSDISWPPPGITDDGMSALADMFVPKGEPPFGPPPRPQS